MKKIFLNKIITLLVAMILLASCKDLFNVDDIKKNPNAPLDAPVDVMISGTLVGVGALHEDTDVRIAYIWAGQLTGLSRQHLSYADYQVSSGTFGWGNLYNVASNARLIQTKAATVNNKWEVGIGQIMEALVIEKATDLYGDVPYSQAFDIDKYPTPIFDKQLDVYNELLSTLNLAIENLSSSAGISPASNYEFVYGGDVVKWKAAAYTLKARLYLHLGDYANAVLSANSGISSPAGDALIPHGLSQQVDENSNFDFFNNSRPGDTGFSPPAFLPSFMAARVTGKTNETALFNHFFQKGIYTDGLDPNTGDGNGTTYGFFKADAYQPLLTFYENQLILAEALARQGGLSQPAIDALNSVRQVLKTGYINGQTIIAKYQALGIKYDDFVIADFADQSALLKEIISEKYIVLLSQYESYNDVRRLSKESFNLGIQPIVPTATGGLPQRFIYPQVELNTNPNAPNPAPDQWQKLPIFQ